METKTADGLSDEEKLKTNLSHIKNKLIVLGGKGGVGKTTVAVNLACGLAARKYEVGILDVDVHGPNIAKMLGIEGQRLGASGHGIKPIQVLPHLKAISLSLIMENPDQPIIWRGPMKAATIKQFLTDVNWGNLDYLIIDSPPGTGDEPLTICQLIKDLNGAIIVTTPQDMAILDTRKSIMFAKELKIPFSGVVENMGGFVCPHCKKEIDLFGSGGGEKAAKELGVEFLGRIPVDGEIVKRGDSGKPFIFSEENTYAANVMNEIIEKVIKQLNQTA